MSEGNEKLTELEWHRKIAAKLFNQTWDLMDKEERNQEENDEMIHSSHASRYHWGVVVASGKYPKTGPINLERGDWQVSRVYCLTENAESAKYHAQRCLKICQENNIGDFDIAFAYEGMARAFSVSGNESDEVKKYLDLANEAGTKIKKKEDKDWFISQLKTVPGYSET
ncbi:MAG: hypothetical protein ACFFFG_14745 [Candidatus Thorarchaeota archaeon]